MEGHAMSILTKILAGGTDKVVDSLASGLDGLLTSKEEKLQLQNELEALLISDKQDARDMYQHDPWLQKIYALVFLVGYLILTVAMLFFMWKMVVNTLELPDWAIAFVSTIWGGMSTKVNTVTDFLFGSSRGSQQKDVFPKKMKR